MSTPIPSYFGQTGDPIIDGVTTGYYWRLGADRTIDWSISDGFAGEHWNNEPYLQAQIGAMLGTFSYYANVKFNYVGYYTTPYVAYGAGSEINVSLDSQYFFSSSNTWARSFFPEPTTTLYTGDSGDVFLNMNSPANTLSSYAPGSAGWMVFLHELGHAVGLKHPHDDGGTGRPTLEQLGLGSLDIDYATIMSYNDDYNWNLRSWDPATPMILDVLALQYLYGKNMNTNASDTFYSLARTGNYQTWWDAGGTDTVSAALQGEGWLVMLPNTRLSSLVDTKAGFAAPGADLALTAPTTLIWLAGDIENATGSNFGDVLVGSDAANRLTGNGGNDFLKGLRGDDVIDGGSGIDIAAFQGLRSQYVITVSTGGTTVAGPDGVDSLTQVERLQFDDVDIATDLGGNAGMTAKLLGAVFGSAAVHNTSFVGIGLNLFDSGWTYTQVADLALDAALGSARSNTSVFDLLYFDTVGSHAAQATADYWVGQLQSGAMSQAQLATFAADMDLNLANIGFVGLTTTGVEYTA
jgi:hypothetical protein